MPLSIGGETVPCGFMVLLSCSFVYFVDQDLLIDWKCFYVKTILTQRRDDATRNKNLNIHFIMQP
jgi:hypothetical protein